MGDSLKVELPEVQEKIKLMIEKGIVPSTEQELEAHEQRQAEWRKDQEDKRFKRGKYSEY
jgi:hypothetical protein